MVIGTRATDRIPALIEEALSGKRHVSDLGERAENESWDVSPVERHSAHVAFVPIIEGCNKFCSFCIVPYSRGREQSRSASEIIAEVIKLKSLGYKEIHFCSQIGFARVPANTARSKKEQNLLQPSMIGNEVTCAECRFDCDTSHDSFSARSPRFSEHVVYRSVLLLSKPESGLVLASQSHVDCGQRRKIDESLPTGRRTPSHRPAVFESPLCGHAFPDAGRKLFCCARSAQNTCDKNDRQLLGRFAQLNKPAFRNQ